MRMRSLSAGLVGLGGASALLVAFLRDGASRPLEGAGGAAIRSPAPSPGTAAGPALPDPGASLAGRVESESGAPAGGASVVVDGPQRRDFVADGRGVFEVHDLPPGEYVVSAFGEANASEPVGPIPLSRGELVGGLVLRLFPSATLSGVVRDQQTRAPIAFAWVAGGASRTAADREGRFRLNGLAGGAMRVSAGASGYLTRASDVVLSRGKERSGTEIHLEAAGRIEGNVRDTAGRAVVGAKVSARAYSIGRTRPGTSPVASSDGRGDFVLEVRPAEVTVVAEARGYAPASLGPMAIAAGKPQKVDLVLGLGQTAFGQVRRPTASGRALGCEVSFHEPLDGRELGAARASPDGRYVVDHLPAGPAIALADCGPDGAAQRADVRVPEADAIEVDIDLGTGNVEGRVVDAAGRPVRGAAVAAGPDASAVAPVVRVVTGADGSFRFGGVSDGLMRVVAESEVGWGEARGVTPGDRGVTIRVGSGDIVGHVGSADGDSVSDFVAVALPADGLSGRTRSERCLAPTGDFRLPVTPGRYHVHVRAPGFPPTSQGPVSVETGKQTPTLRFTLSRPGIIAGVALSDGKPVSQARVATHWDALWSLHRSMAGSRYSWTATDVNGRFVISDVEAGTTLRLFAYRPGFELWGEASVAVPVDGQPTEVVIWLRRSPHQEPPRDFGGVGVGLGGDGKLLFATMVMEGGPAWEAGMREGDAILSVDRVPLAGLTIDQVVNRIRGEVGTTVTLGLKRAGQPLEVSVARTAIRY